MRPGRPADGPATPLGTTGRRRGAPGRAGSGPGPRRSAVEEVGTRSGG